MGVFRDSSRVNDWKNTKREVSFFDPSISQIGSFDNRRPVTGRFLISNSRRAFTAIHFLRRKNVYYSNNATGFASLWDHYVNGTPGQPVP